MVGTGGVIVAPSNAGREKVRNVGFGAEPTFVGHAQIDAVDPQRSSPRPQPAQIGSRDSICTKDDLDFAVQAIRCDYESNRPSQLVGDQIAYQARAITG
jgi:hypothetical protein